MKLKEAEKAVLCFYYQFKPNLVSHSELNSLIGTRFKSSLPVQFSFKNLKAYRLIESENGSDANISTNGITEIEGDDNLLKHCILQALSNKETHDPKHLNKSITINYDNLIVLLQELHKEGEVTLTWRNNNSGRMYYVEIESKGKVAFFLLRTVLL